MSTRSFCVVAALAAATLLMPSPTAVAKDDPATIKANRDAVRKKFKDAKKLPFADLSYYLDVNKLKDQRWEIADLPAPATDDAGGHMFRAVFPSGNAADAAPSVTINIFRTPHWKDEGAGRKTVFSQEFKSWGQSVKTSDVKDMAAGFYEDWIREAKDVIKDKCRASDNKKIGPADFWSYAVGTDKEEAKRVRKEWYVWAQQSTAPPFTWIAIVTISDKFHDNDAWIAKVAEFMKNIQELKDPKLK